MQSIQAAFHLPSLVQAQHALGCMVIGLSIASIEQTGSSADLRWAAPFIGAAALAAAFCLA
ncbi:MAG: hypothetical protein ACO33A_13540 [Hyphomonas sp.]|jgi:hypothetical protein